MSIQSEINRIRGNVSGTLDVLSAAGLDTTGAGSNELPVLVSEMSGGFVKKYDTGYTTYCNAGEEGVVYRVDIPDFDATQHLKAGVEVKIIPHVTSVIRGPSLIINGGEAHGIRVTSSTTDSSFNGTRADFMAAGAPVKLMLIYRVDDSGEERYLWRLLNSVRVNIEALVSNGEAAIGTMPVANGVNEKPLWKTPAEVGADINKATAFTASSSNGVAYTVNVPGVTAYYKGLQVTIIPSRESTSKQATVNVNGLGAKRIYFNSSGRTGGYFTPKETNFLSSGIAVTLTYAGSAWRAMNTITTAEHIDGAVALKNGGTGATTAAAARSNLGVPSLAEFNALLARVEALENGGGASTSTFSIWFEGDEFTYTFENGMTWSEFLASSYNEEIECMNCGAYTRAFAADGNHVFFKASPEGCASCNDWTYVLRYDPENGEDYVWLTNRIDSSAEYVLGNP